MSNDLAHLIGLLIILVWWAVPTILDQLPFTRRGTQECITYKFDVEFRRESALKSYEKQIEMHVDEDFHSDMNKFKVGGSVGVGVEMFSSEVSFEFGKATKHAAAQMNAQCKASEKMTEFQGDVMQIYRVATETFTTDGANKLTFTKKDWIDTQLKNAGEWANCKTSTKNLLDMAKEYVLFRFGPNSTAGKTPTGTISPANTYTETQCLAICE